MSKNRWTAVYIVDFLVAVAVFFFCRDAGGYPRWYWLVATGVFWALFGMLTNKLQFWKFFHVRWAVLCILLVDAVTSLIILTAWTTAFPERVEFLRPWPPFALLTIFEVGYYIAFRRVYRKQIPFLYEDIIAGERCEPAFDKSLRVEEDRDVLPEEFLRIYDSTRSLSWEELRKWFKANEENIPGAIAVQSIDTIPPTAASKLAIVVPPVNDLRHINTMFAQVNRHLAKGGCIVVHATTSSQRRETILKGCPPVLNYLLYLLDYIWSRVFPKLHLTRWFYMAVTKGQGRNLPRVEILGRLSRAGFTIAGEQYRDGEYFLTGVKTAEPIVSDKPSYGPLIRLRRIGYHGERISVYKFRTMYTYSEYIQKYTCDRLGLQKGGKIKNDFRVNIWGKLLRPIWVDELPMLINWIRGDMKLVGVRPLSSHYFSLYTPEMQQYRLQVKPGLIPPFYYDNISPDDIKAVQENEHRYIEAYLKAPRRTDIRYFFGCMYNIIIRHLRSH